MESLRNILPALTRLVEHPSRGEALPAPVAAALAWEMAAGPELAARAPFHAWHGSVLLLRAADATIQAQIKSVAPELLRALNRMLPTGNDGKPSAQPCRRIQFLP